MAHNDDISHKATQERIFRIAQRNGLTLKAISLDSGIPYSTLRGYAGHSGEPTEMPISAVAKLVGVIPDELLSLLLPEGRAIVAVPSEIDHDEIERAILDYAATKSEFHRPESECGRDLGPTELATLDSKVVRLPIMGRVAA
jgi:transcriptional regulator with XRE-family HTH domain